VCITIYRVSEITFLNWRREIGPYGHNDSV
jgi:hypothetical protein